MNSPIPLATPRSGIDLWRHLAAALHGLEDFELFTAALQAAVNAQDPDCRFTWTLPRDGGPPAIALPVDAGGLTAPIGAEGRVAGSVIKAASRRFGPADLHVLGDLAEFLGAALAATLRSQRDAERRALLRLLLDQAPVGIAAFHHREIVIANGLAERWLTELGTQWLEAETVVHRGTVSGHLIFCEVRNAMMQRQLRVAVMHDLSPAQARLIESLETSYYRTQATLQPASFVLLESKRASGDLYRMQGEVQRLLGPQACVGPYDSSRIGAIVPERGARLRARLRKLRILPVWDQVHAGLVDLSQASNVEDALSRATLQPRPLAELLHPRILVTDSSPSIQRALQTFFHGQADVVAVPRPELARFLSRTDADAALLEFASTEDETADLAKLVRQEAPGMKFAFAMPSPLSPRWCPEIDAVAKPFSREELRRALLPET